MTTNRPRSRKTSSTGRRLGSLHWLFRTNIPNRRGSPLPNDIHKRNFFGMSEIIGVLTNPAETVRSLTESRRLLEEARKEISENRERAQLRTKHTFSRLPGFFPRSAEVRAIERAMEGEPSFTVLFGASSVGKTALLREVLSRDAYHVLHFDLRIAGFADLASLYMSMSQQMEQYWEEIARQIPGYEEFEKEGWSFKHDRLNVEKRLDAPAGTGQVKTSDIARLMELFQSSLLKYWEFDPLEDKSEGENKPPRRRSSSETLSERTQSENNKPKSKWSFGTRSKTSGEHSAIGKGKEKEKEAPPKKMPVIFFDEAHKLPALIHSTDAMKCILDAMLVLTKQDRLCHVIHATSDPFFQTWLRQLNVMQHCKIITVGDCSRAETQAFFNERMLPRVPEHLHAGLQFETLYDAFGGKLTHWYDYMTDYVNANGSFEIKQSSHFLQAHALLNLHIIHSSQSNSSDIPGDGPPLRGNTSSTQGIHPGLGAAGFKIYSPITNPQGPSNDQSDAMHDMALIAGHYHADFSAMQLLKVMSRLSQPDVKYLPYFLLCREMGVRAVDGMVKGRILDLRWTETVTKEASTEEERTRVRTRPAAGSSGTAVEMTGSEEEEWNMVAVSEGEVAFVREDEEAEEVVGPRLVPTTPIMRYAMREVVQEYEDVQSVSEYASLSDVDEY